MHWCCSPSVTFSEVSSHISSHFTDLFTCGYILSDGLDMVIHHQSASTRCFQLLLPGKKWHFRPESPLTQLFRILICFGQKHCFASHLSKLSFIRIIVPLSFRISIYLNFPFGSMFADHLCPVFTTRSISSPISSHHKMC